MFSDIFYIIIIPILTAIVVGFGVNFYARMRESTHCRKLQDKIAVLDKSIEVLRQELDRLREISDNRGRMLVSLQQERLPILERLKGSLGLEDVIRLDSKPSGLPADAVTGFKPILEEIEELRSLEIPIISELAYYLALLLYANRQFDKAIAFLREALEGDSTNQEARISLGNLLLQQRKNGEARTQFKELVDLAGHRFEAHLGLGLALNRLGKFDEGILALTTAIRLRPESARIYSELGRAYVNIGELSRALESAQVSLKLEPEMEEGHILHQEILIRSGDFKGAIEECRRWLVNGESPKVLYNLAVAYSKSGDLDGAIDSLRRATTLDDALRLEAKDDPAFTPLHGSRRFVEVLEGRPGLF